MPKSTKHELYLETIERSKRAPSVTVRAVPFIHTDRLVVTFGPDAGKAVLTAIAALASHSRGWLACLSVMFDKPESIEVVDGNVCAKWNDARGRHYWQDAAEASALRGYTAFTDYSFFLNKHTFTLVLPCP